MDTDHIEIIIVDQWNIEDIISLYKAGKWWKPGSDTTIIPTLIKNSFAFAVAINNRTYNAVGMGRVLSDGISDAYIQDVVVLEEWRKRGIGKKIIQTLINYCLSKQVTWIALISEPGQDVFYQPLGFKEMKEYIPMIYEYVK